jgi:hypothetical protein
MISFGTLSVERFRVKALIPAEMPSEESNDLQSGQALPILFEIVVLPSLNGVKRADIVQMVVG